MGQEHEQIQYPAVYSVCEAKRIHCGKRNRHPTTRGMICIPPIDGMIWIAICLGREEDRASSSQVQQEGWVQLAPGLPFQSETRVQMVDFPDKSGDGFGLS